jgi:protein TonB
VVITPAPDRAARSDSLDSQRRFSLTSWSLVRRSLVPAALALLFAGPLASTASAQDGKVYAIAEVTNPPKLTSSALAARLIQESYPEDLRKRGVGGMVELSFVVDAKGKVDPASVEVVDATQTALGEAAKKIVSRLDFAPGKLNGGAVKTKVVLPIIYKP